MSRRIIVIVVALITQLLLLSSSSNADSDTPDDIHYDTNYQWLNSSITYGIDPNLGANLGVGNNGAIAINQAATNWNNASRFRLNSGAYDPNGNSIRTANFQVDQPCGAPPNSTWFAVVCPTALPFPLNRILTRSTMWFNVFNTTWNTNQTVSCNPRLMDVRTVALHEFGHFHSLADNPAGVPNAVMTFTCFPPPKLSLHEDDKRGATQLYGPWTSFEDRMAQGDINRIAYIRTVVGYNGNQTPPPELGRVTNEFGVSVPSEVWYLRMAGTAQTSYSYAYLTLFTNENNTGQPLNVAIQNGMKLRWLQYNYQQRTMSLDFQMDNGASLRDSGIRDQNGIGVHPAARGAYPTGQWLFFEADLSPLVGRTITRYFVGYDNGNNGVTGQFRAYFEDIQLVW